MSKLSKLPSQVSTEDLIAALEKNEATTEILEYKNDILPFLGFYGLQSGGYPVNTAIIFNLYKQWSKNPSSRNTFGLEVNKYLFIKQIGKKWYYYINFNALKLSEKSFKLLKKNTRDKRKSPTYTKHFNSFLKHYNIRSGNTFIPFYGLYHLYDSWCYKNKAKAMGYKTLHDFCALHFNSKRINDSKGLAFSIHKDIKYHINEKIIEEIKEARKKEKKSKGKK